FLGGHGAFDPNYDAGGGGGAGWYGGGAGASTVQRDVSSARVSGGGGGGGSSYIAGTLPLLNGSVAPQDIAADLGARRATVGAGAAGSVTLDWIPCDYDLAVTKTVDDPTPLIGDTVEWTITVTNNGPDFMTRGDTVTISDTLPGAGTKTI